MIYRLLNNKGQDTLIDDGVFEFDKEINVGDFIRYTRLDEFFGEQRFRVLAKEYRPEDNTITYLWIIED